ncbi:hypothetical protein [Nocardia sp. GTS18]|uniref:hypothetical protein n=1 Tax=Nocardia sp. GTS18 TaxID=1778064 RepID=UPI00210491C9|nr:hypothetical protein [Nocardia sp. GTS18]
MPPRLLVPLRWSGSTRRLAPRHTADDLLADEPTERAWFEAAVRDCAAYWSRRDVVFRVVLQGDPVTFGAVALVE